jgi:hypothetical protein
VDADSIDWEHESKAQDVFHAAEQQVGEDRFGGGWIDRTSARRPVLGIALVDPTPEDLDVIEGTAREAGWPVTVDIVKYSRAALVAFYDTLSPPANFSVSAWGWDPRFNRVVVRLTRLDEETQAFFRNRIPADALLLRYVSDEKFVAM